ncbi:nickel-binding protein [uncultured Paracoccus sp.]|nr:nickel-binding protein [uncultured Paracoccus sp.]
MIERDIPAIGQMSAAELCAAASASNQALEQIGTGIQWVQSYVARDKTFCIYLADSEAAIRKHSELSGIPVGAITEVPQVIDPLTAKS